MVPRLSLQSCAVKQAGRKSHRDPRSTTRRSKSCSRATGEWQSCWSRPENQIMRAEMTEHPRGEPGEQTKDRCGYRNESCERRLTTRIGTIELEVPRDREATFFSGSLPTLPAEREGARAGADAAGPIRESSPVESRRSPRGPAAESSRSGPRRGPSRSSPCSG